MVATDKVFAGSIPELYDRYLVPLIFDAYASDLAARLDRKNRRIGGSSSTIRTAIPLLILMAGVTASNR